VTGLEFSKTFNQAIAHKAKLDNMKKDYDDNLVKIGRYHTNLNALNNMFIVTCTAHDYLETLVKEESTKFVRRLRDILDYGVKTIFYDEEYSIDVRTEEDSATIHLVTKDDCGNVISPDIKVCGGGIRTVVGIMLQLFFIFHYKAEHVIFIDEGFTQVSSQYIPYLMGLLQELSEKNGLKLLLVSHDVRVMGYADKVYEIVEGKAYLRKGKDSKVSVVGGGSNDPA
jgi:DNA repair exonuclease SbcCD ATPase subunit